MRFIVKLSFLGLIAIFSFAVFIVYIVFDNLETGGIADNMDDVNYFVPSKAGNVAGTFAIAFMVHNGIS